jgi:hypothetical protein
MPIARLLACAALAATMLPLAYTQSVSPTEYTVTQGTAGGGISIIYRSGTKALQELHVPANGTAPAGHSLTLYDLTAGTYWIWNPTDNPIQCSSGSIKGDWGDPFKQSAGMGESIQKGELKPAGTETIGGIPTQIYTQSSDQVAIKVWYDSKDNLVLRATMTMPGSPATTMADIREVSFAPPSPELFSLPAACTAAKAPPKPDQAIADVTGGDDPANYANAIYSAPSKDSCNVVLRILHAKTMAPVINIQVFLDTSYDPSHPQHDTIKVGNDWRETYIGGSKKEIASPAKNGVFRLGAVPDHFMLDVHVVTPNGIDSTGLIYRQCFAPTTVLLYLVRDSIDGSHSPDWLWVKSGKYAVP